MSEEQFASSEDERKLFVASLRDFSDRCSAPDLTPACPFYENTPLGALCGEQCHDVLAENSRYFKDRSWHIGDGIAAYSRPGRRARRGPEPTARPFDARAISLRDKDRPTDVRHTISLLYDLKRLFQTPGFAADDPEENVYLVKAYVRELTKRGFARGDLVTAGARFAAVAQSMAIAVHFLVGDEDTVGGEFFEVPEDWKVIGDEVLLASGDSSPAEVLSKLSSFAFMSLTRWNASLALDELAEGKAPPLEVVRGGVDSLSNELESKIDSGKWIFDRFTETYPNDWSEPSLHAEWQYLHSSVKGCCNSEMMKLRRTSADAIAREIAEHTVTSAANQRRKRDVFESDDFKSAAIECLSSGRHEAAATVYEALLMLKPNDPDALNNLGFCLLPTDPLRALDALVKSIEVNEIPMAVTRANEALALLLLGQFDKARESIVRLLDLDATSGLWLWRIAEDGSLVLAKGVDSETYAGELLAEIERRQTAADASTEES